ncbi:MAG TPA: RluA family pseudouridine synthase [Candidatus Jorgensenbacteria bacterium]|nr:RluA family pseudouridine synthase [Candidatus Jorgensenbacteria bacterium]
MHIQIIYENKNFAVLNKPAGILVHQIQISSVKHVPNKEETVADWLVARYPEASSVGDKPSIRPGIVHRLDKETSGVMVIARTQEFFDYFKNLLKERKAQKTYIALVWGKLPKRGLIDTPIGLKPGTIRRTTRGKKMKMVKDAVTEYHSLEYFEQGGEIFTLAELFPKTGRTHQLRVHMASIHHSVVGDVMYGRKENPFNIGRHFLHAKTIEFGLLNNKLMKFEAPIPEDLKKILHYLQNI